MSYDIKITQDKTFETIKSAVDQLVNTIKPTFGAAGNKVLIDSPNYFSPLVVDDGVQIARDFELEDKSENAWVKFIRETAVKTNDRVGDGTTGALIMLQGIITEVARRSKRDGRRIALELRKGLLDVQKSLRGNVKLIKSKEDLKKVALIAFDNEKIAELIADTYHKLGQDGIITIEKSPSMESTVELSDGLQINNGYISPYMVTNPERMEAVIEKPYLLLTDYRVTETSDILPIMEKLQKSGKQRLVILAENVEQNALATLVINLAHVMNPQTQKLGTFQAVAVVGPKDQVALEDIALLTGAKVFTQSKGDKLETAEITDLGQCQKFICRQTESIIVGPKGNKADIGVAITSLRTAVENEKDLTKKQSISKRLGVFTNTLAVIKVGAMTENEQKALKYKVEDCVNAVKSAFKHGVVAGGGFALSRIKTSSPILNEALQYPNRQLLENMSVSIDHEYEPDEVYNVVTDEFGDFMKVGVMDSAEVLLAGVESAVSIASILVTSSGMIVKTQKEPK